MTSDLRAQLERYTKAVVEQQTPITAAEAEAWVGVIRELPEAPEDPARMPVRRRWAISAAAAVTLLLVVGVAWLAQFLPRVEPADQPAPTTTPIPTSSLPSAPDLAGARAVVLDAFTAVGDADVGRFLRYLDPEGVFRDTDTRQVFRWSDDLGVQLRIKTDDFDSDHNGDGVVNRVEQFLMSATYLALAPITVSGCEAVDAGIRCLVEDNEVFYAALGIELEPIPVTVSDGRIVEIELNTSAGTGVVAHPLGKCDACGVFAVGAWMTMREQYMSWLGLGVGDSFRWNDPLAFRWYSGLSPLIGAPGEVPWVHPDSFAQHRELIPQWLASQPSESAQRDALDSYIETLTQQGHPPPEFDTADLGIEQELTVIPIDGNSELGDCTEDATDPYWVVAARLSGRSITALYRIEAFDSQGFFFEIAERAVCIHPANEDRGGWDHHARYDIETSPAPYLVVITAFDFEGPDWLAVGGIPTDTAVVVVPLTDGTTTWQRPVNGLALLDTTPGINGPVRLIDQTGADIFHIELLQHEGWDLIGPTQDVP